MFAICASNIWWIEMIRNDGETLNLVKPSTQLLRLAKGEL
jgi:hypothetical protein